MAARGRAPRTVADATRFTASTPHANTKSGPASSSATSSTSKQTPPGSSSRHQPQQRGGIPPPPSSSSPQQRPQQPAETIEERVRRLRAAHLAAKQHDISRFDRVVNASRRYFNAVHKVTVMGLIGFSGLALFVTIYATADMMLYNRKRHKEFWALQQRLRDDSLEAARLAYMTGTASEDQIAMVEDATAKAKQAGIELPSLLSAPQQVAGARFTTTATTTATTTTDADIDTTTSTTTTPRSVFPGEALTESSVSGAGEDEEWSSEKKKKKKKKGGITGWLFGGLKKEEDQDDAATGSGSLSFSHEEAAARAAVAADGLRDKAKAAFDQERENQRRGGPLDQVGLDDAAKSQQKRGWFR